MHDINYETIPITHDLDGKIFSSVKIRLPENHKCYSASGVFPNCDRKIPQQAAACPADGESENTLETEYHFETDYSDGLITFTRMYRSDNAWGGGAFGDHWRHNYEKKLNVITSLAGANAENVTIGVPDDFGNETVFVMQDDGGWQAAEGSPQQSLITVYDEFDQDLKVGYHYISESDVNPAL